MAFQEPIDPFVEKLQVLIDDLKQDINYRGFEEILTKIDEEFPFVDLSEFLEMYVDGEYSKVLIEKFHLCGFIDYYKLLQILKLNKKRRSVRKDSTSRKTNFTDSKLARRYEILNNILTRFQKSIKNKINYNVLRAVIILQLYLNEQNFTDSKKILESVQKTIKDFEHLILAPHTPLSTIKDDEIKKMLDMILLELKNNSFIEIDNSNNFRLEVHQLLICKYIFNNIQNRKDGITYQELVISIKHKLPILLQIPPALIIITLQDFINQNMVIRKEGYWKFKPFFDQYFTFENYEKMNFENTDSFRKNREFFGRKITPKEFIQELFELQRGNFEDQDDQVTRIAGMVLTNSNMMSHPPNDLKEFDFVVDLSRYEFTKKQQQIISNLNLEIKSNIIYVKVMINDEIKVDEISDLILKLKKRERNEQGFIISFTRPEKIILQILEKNKTIQIISENELREWCKITPIIPSRRGAVAIIRQGDNRESIVKIKSVNYESGRADVILLPKMNESTQYIGSLEELTIPINIKKFIDYSNIYFQFLSKLRQISKTDIFKKIISESISKTSTFNKIVEKRIIFEKEIEYRFVGNSKCRIDFIKYLDKDSLKYRTDDLFSCTCFQWDQKSKTNGLCEHLIFILNESIKEIFSLENKVSEREIAHYLLLIEQRMDLFLKRLRFSNNDGSMIAECPNCGQIEHNLKGVEERFGYRQMNKDNKFSLRRQSRCKECR